VLGIVAAALVVLYVVLYRTRIGLIVRAGIEDQLMVNILGINVTRTFLVVFGLGSMAAGFAGVINSPIVTVNPEMGGLVLVQSFVVIVIGGVGSFWGAVVGGLIAGEILSLTSMVQPAYSQVMLFAAMALVLILRPQGLFGVQGRE
jgi:branched-chain amino acid transport system permease protein